LNELAFDPQIQLSFVGVETSSVPGCGIIEAGWRLAVVQIGILPIVIPVLMYGFSTADTLTAVLLLIWSVLVGRLDNVLKPLLLGRGVNVPMAVIFVGAIGGFLTSGIVGLSVGSVILVLGYQIFMAWVYGPAAAPLKGEPPRAADKPP
jgi:predicted PurR-regulated permease PerM